MEENEIQKKRGVTSHDRKLAGDVRRMTLEQIKRILETPRVEMNEKDYVSFGKPYFLACPEVYYPDLRKLPVKKVGRFKSNK